jgi:heme-degrading monooxygenase HmoA
MHARVTIVEGQPDRLEEGIRTFRERTLPLIQGRAGFGGAHLLVDRQQGRALAISLWESEGAMQQTEDAIARQREQAAQQMGASAPMVERYEVAFADGEPTGRAARVTAGEGMAESMDAGRRYVREHVVPAVTAAPGFRGMLHLEDRRAGKVLVVIFVDSEEALRQSAEAAQRLRAGAERAGIAGTRTGADYEVAVQA